MSDSIKVLSQKDAEAVVNQVKSSIHSHGTTNIMVFSCWSSGQRWARNKAMLTSDKRDVRLRITHDFGNIVRATSNQIDEESLTAICKMINVYANRAEPKEIFVDKVQDPVTYDSKGATLWSDSTFNRQALDNAPVVHSISDQANGKGFFASGYIENAASFVLNYERDRWGREYTTSGKITQAHCSMTVRDPSGNGSGWAGGSSFDMQRLDPEKIGASAIEKCTLSLNAVRIEPGRYQTILEPQAASFFFMTLVSQLRRLAPELAGVGPVYLEVDELVSRRRTKLGLKVVDERINIWHDPVNPLVGTHVDPGIESTTLIENGILKNLFNSYEHSLKELVQKEYTEVRSSFGVTGSKVTVEEMIATTKRGLLVTRVSDPIVVGGGLFTGTTRDGLWLIENGKITKAVRNFRWTESPWFVFNNVEELGQSIPVFTPVDMRNSLQTTRYSGASTSVVCPWIKINDFSFTSTVDAI